MSLQFKSHDIEILNEDNLLLGEILLDNGQWVFDCSQTDGYLLTEFNLFEIANKLKELNEKA